MDKNVTLGYSLKISTPTHSILVSGLATPLELLLLSLSAATVATLHARSNLKAKYGLRSPGANPS